MNDVKISKEIGINLKRAYVRVEDIDVKHTNTYTMFQYYLNCYEDPLIQRFITKKKLVSFKPLDLRVGSKYMLTDLGWKETFKNLVWDNENSRILPIQDNDLWKYM